MHESMHQLVKDDKPTPHHEAAPAREPEEEEEEHKVTRENKEKKVEPVLFVQKQ